MESRKKKIAVIGTRGIPATYGGIEKHCEKLYSLIFKSGYDVTIYARKFYFNEDIKEFNGIKLVKIHVPNIQGAEAFIYSFIATILAVFSNADIIHFHAQGPTLFSWIPRLFTPNKKVVFTCHGIDWQRGKWGLIGKTVIKLGEKASAIFPHSVITVSQSLADYYKKKYNINTVKIVNGTDIPDKTPLKTVKDKFGLKEKEYFIFVGRLVPEKDTETLIKAMKKLKTDKKLLIVGDTEDINYFNYLKNMANGDNRIIFTGYCFGKDLNELYSNAFAYVTASKLEGLPITVLEAMSYSLPVIMSNIEPHNEIKNYNENNFISFETSNVGDCKTAMEKMLFNVDINMKKILENIADSQKKIIREHFSWEKAAEETLKFYEEVIK